MRIRLLCVGKPRDRRMAALHDAYAERILRLGVGYASAWVPEVRADGHYSPDHVREREAAELLDALDARATLVALDRFGELLSSEELARRLESWATPRAEIVVGGPLGLHRAVLERAGQRWSLSPLTFPHELVRVLIAEQVYRALAIRRGLPYHR
jgi:23S rRNA (pseudouridine1915-N3)-methyltransferase